MAVDNLIVITGGAYSEVKRALRQWIDLYSNDLQDGLTFQLFKNGRGNHIIQADKRLDNERFFYLVNYLYYPEGIEYKIDIEGFTTGRENAQLKGKHLLVYLSLNDKEGDNVYVMSSENENFKVDFGGIISETSDTKVFKLPTGLIFEYPEVFTVNKKTAANQKQKVNVNSIKKRFKQISLIILGLFVTSVIVFFFNTQVFITISFFLGVCISVWFFADYELLQSGKHYIYCLLISLVFLGCMLFFTLKINNAITIDVLGALLPLSFLVVQKPMRIIFKTFLKREPIIDKPPPSFWDGVYTVIMFCAPYVLPFIIVVVLKYN